MVKVIGNSLRIGNIINHQNVLWIVTKKNHVQPGKGGAFVQLELKGLLDGTKKNERFRSSEEIERVYLDERKHTYLYQEGDFFIFMDESTFEQITIDKKMLEDQSPFLQNGMVVDVCFYNDQIVSIRLPDTVILEVVEAEPVVKGQTASSSYKPAVLENGLRVMVPPHIGNGMRVVINTEDFSYVERAKD